MATKTLISEEEYLHMTFDGPEPDYVNGELVERSMPNLLHGTMQSIFSGLVFPWRAKGLLFCVTELRIPTAPGHYRIVDAVLYRDRRPVDLVPAETPFVTLEIVSPDDPHEELMTKLAEYKSMGVPHVWLADPGLKTLSVYDRGSLLRVDAFELPEFGLRITAADLLG